MNEVLKIVISLSMSASLVALVLMALRPLYKNRLHGNWQYYIWLVVVARLLVPLAPEANLVNLLWDQLPPETAPTVVLAPAEEAQDYPTLTPPAAVPHNAAADPTPAPRRWTDAALSNLWAAWLLVALLLLVRKATSYHGFVRYIRAGCREVDSPEVLDAYFTACRDMGVKRPPALHCNPLAASPMLVGILRPQVVIPDDTLPPEALEMVFRHELAHHRRRDILYKWLVQLAVCLHWFNPLVYLISREIARACEIACDEAVLRSLPGEEQRPYGDALLSAAGSTGRYGSAVASVTLSEDGRLLRERLDSILRYARKSRVTTLCAVLLAAVALGGAAFAGAYTGTKATVAAVRTLPVTTLAEQELAGRGAAAPGGTVSDGRWDRSWDWQGYTGWENWGWDDWGWDDENWPSGAKYSTAFYTDNYLYGLIWLEQADTGTYGTSVTLEVDGTGYAVAFREHSEGYARDSAFLEALRRDIATVLQSRRVSNAWAEGMFVVHSASGPHGESPDTLARRFYQEQNIGYFALMLPECSPSTVEALLYTAYDDGAKTSYFALLLGHLPQDANLDNLARRALADGRTELLALLINWVDEPLRTEIINGMIPNVPGIPAALRTFATDDADKDALAMQAVSDRDIASLSLLLDSLSQETAEALAEEAFNSGSMAEFSLLMGRLSNEQLNRYAQRAFDEQRYALQAILMEYL